MEDDPRPTKSLQYREEVASMPTIGALPTIVQEALAVFGEGCDTDAARRPFAAYLTGRMGAARQTVSGITRALALTTDPSCLPRWLTEVPWDVQTVNKRRVASLPSTRPGWILRAR